MRFSKHLNPKSVLLGIKAGNKEELFRQMAAAMLLNADIHQAGLTEDTIVKAILTREAQATTGIGKGFAFPHARVAGLDTLAISLAVLTEDFEYGSIDNKPVKVVCMVLAPEKRPTLALKVMSQVARFFDSPVEAAKLHAAKTGEEVVACIDQAQIDLDVAVTAWDIMSAPDVAVPQDMPLRKVTKMMSSQHLNAVPVVDGEDKVIGEISCARLFQLGVPEFFTKLKSVGFICEFDPFDKYFAEESQALAKDVMLTECCVLPPDATLLEVIFELTVKQRAAVYVADKQGKLLGVVDQSTVLDQVLNI